MPGKYSKTGTEEDHQNFRKIRKTLKKTLDEKMRLNVKDDTNPSLISKNFGSMLNLKVSQLESQKLSGITISFKESKQLSRSGKFIY